MKDWDCYAFMVSKQQKEHGMDISLFLESPCFMMSDYTLPPIHFQGSPSLLPMTFLFAMDEIETIGAKARSSISHFPQKMYNIDTDF